MMKTISVLAISIAVLGLALFPYSSPPPATDPLINPDKAAWELFVSVNKPVNGNALLWETWTQAARIFEIPVKPKTPAKFSGKFELSKAIRNELLLQPPDPAPDPKVVFQHAEPKLCSPELTDSRHQVMFNDDMVRYIMDNELYNVEGQIAAVQKGEIQFPPTSIAVKAVWEPIDPQSKDQFYYRECGNSVYGLIALHIASKRLKDWFWTTFEHTKTDEKHNQDQCQKVDCVDTFGAVPPTGLQHQQTPELVQLLSQIGSQGKSVWSHYRLIGTQVNFTNAMGKTLLGNSILEKGMVASSSCITCHSRSTISKDKTLLSVVKSDKTGFTGEKEPGWYLDDKGQPKFYQLDYLWSFILAKGKDTDTPVLPSSLNCNGKEPLSGSPPEDCPMPK